MLLSFLALFGTALTAPIQDSYARYDDHQVIRISNLSEADIPFLLDELAVDFWAEPLANTWDVRVTPEQLVQIKQKGYSYDVVIYNLQKRIDAEQARLAQARPLPMNEEWFTEYHPLNEIYDYYRSLADQYPSLVTYIPSIGTTFQGRDIVALRVRGRADGSRRIFYQGGIHAREWVSPPTVAWIFTQLVEGYVANQTESVFMLDNFEYLFVPIVNPDGYSFTWTNDRLWRKNRRTNSGSSCIGVDLNRNWGIEWQSNPNTCSDTYPGTAAFSERETSSISQWYQSLGNVQAAIDFHAYGQLVLRPYGYTTRSCPDESEIRPLGDGMAEAIGSVHGSRYTSEKSAELYPANGETTDWFYEGNDRYTWGFTFELRDTGRYGFLLPPEQIIPTGEENWAGMVYMAEFLFDNHPGNQQK